MKEKWPKSSSSLLNIILLHFLPSWVNVFELKYRFGRMKMRRKEGVTEEESQKHDKVERKRSEELSVEKIYRYS